MTKEKLEKMRDEIQEHAGKVRQKASFTNYNDEPLLLRFLDGKLEGFGICLGLIEEILNPEPEPSQTLWQRLPRKFYVDFTNCVLDERGEALFTLNLHDVEKILGMIDCGALQHIGQTVLRGCLVRKYIKL